MPAAPDRSKFEPNWFERAFDRTLAVFAPGKAREIAQQRKAYKAFAYRGGQRGQRDRTSATIYPNSSPESSLIQLERIQCMWQSRELSDNFGVADYIYNLFCDYCIPDFSKIRWNTGNADDDVKLRERFLVWAKGMCDYLGRDTLNQLIRLAKRSQLRDGDMAFRCVSETIELGKLSRKCMRLQLFEADCIGSPFNVVVSPTYIGGLILEEKTKRVLQFDLYDRPPQGSTYIPLAKVDASEMIHFRKLRRGGQYRGIPLLAPALPAYVDLAEILDNERIGTKAQSNIWAFITSPTGDSSDDEMVYPGIGTPANIDPGTGQTRTYKDLTPGTAMYGNPGETPTFMKNERPSPAFVGLVKTLFMEIFCCSGVDYAFGYDASDLQGTAMRLTSAKTQRTFQQDWTFNEEYLFFPIINRWLEHERQNGYLDDLSKETLENRSYTNYSLTQPAHPSADVGRESAANLAELAAKIKSRHTIAVEQGLDWEVQKQQIMKEDADLSGGQMAIAESLAKSLGDQGLRALQTLAQSYGTGQITHDGAIGFATVILGLDSKSAEKLFPKSAEQKPQSPPKGNGSEPTTVRPGADGERKELSRFKADVADEARDESGKWTTGGGTGRKAPMTPVKRIGEGKDSKLVHHESGEDVPTHISKLKLPPAWTDVKINPDPEGDLLAQGKDAKGRVQSVYSDSHNMRQAALKFARIKELMAKHDDIVAQNANDFSDGAKRENAAVWKLIHATGIRPGSDKDTGAKKKAYGATTLLGQHVTKDDKGNVVLKFTGKKGVDLAIPVHDPEVAKSLIERASKAGSNGKLFNTDDAELRDYTHSLDGGDFKTKDFRTLKGTSTAIDTIKDMPVPTNAKEYKKQVMAVAKIVSQKLGNTPTIALQAYIDPSVFHAWKAAANI